MVSLATQVEREKEKRKREEEDSLDPHTVVANNESGLIECRAVGDGVNDLLLPTPGISTAPIKTTSIWNK